VTDPIEIPDAVVREAYSETWGPTAVPITCVSFIRRVIAKLDLVRRDVAEYEKRLAENIAYTNGQIDHDNGIDRVSVVYPVLPDPRKPKSVTLSTGEWTRVVAGCWRRGDGLHASPICLNADDHRKVLAYYEQEGK
jgi:hypothetical protein